MPDPFVNVPGNLASPAGDGLTVTPHDTNDLATTARGFYVGVAGDVTIVTPAGTTLLFKNVPAGTVVPWRAQKIKATGTTATNIVAAV